MMDSTSGLALWIELLPEPILVLDSAGKILAINSAAREFFGRIEDNHRCSGDPFLGQSIAAWVATPTEQLQKKLKLWQQATTMVPGSLVLKQAANQAQKIEVEAVGIHFLKSPLILLRVRKQRQFLQAFIQQRYQFEKLRQQMARQTALIVELEQRQHALEAENRYLQSMSHRDSLTQLANRRAFEAGLRHGWHEAYSHSTPLAVAMLDIDHFKLYNDTYGHLAGDRALQRVAKAIRSQVREADLVARYGGEEFVLLLRQTHHDVAICVLQRILNYIRSLNIPHAASPVQPYLTLSAGICIATASSIDCPIAELIASADVALYHAKRSGRDRYSIQTYPTAVNDLNQPLRYRQQADQHP
ncbi:sensor domain-containing diguanylate cyclase [Synechococcus sp. PCC 6716]|nr:sensor domain-containing diguanylate cyclase [Synechococcus sp. PCC 6716]